MKSSTNVDWESVQTISALTANTQIFLDDKYFITAITYSQRTAGDPLNR